MSITEPQVALAEALFQVIESIVAFTSTNQSREVANNTQNNVIAKNMGEMLKLLENNSESLKRIEQAIPSTSDSAQHTGGLKSTEKVRKNKKPHFSVSFFLKFDIQARLLSFRMPMKLKKKMKTTRTKTNAMLPKKKWRQKMRALRTLENVPVSTETQFRLSNHHR